MKHLFLALTLAFSMSSFAQSNSAPGTGEVQGDSCACPTCPVAAVQKCLATLSGGERQNEDNQKGREKKPKATKVGTQQ